MLWGCIVNCRARTSEINTPRVFSFFPPFRQETGRKKRGACQPGSGALREEAADQKVKKGLTLETPFAETHGKDHGEDAEEQDEGE